MLYLCLKCLKRSTILWHYEAQMMVMFGMSSKRDGENASPCYNCRSIDSMFIRFSNKYGRWHFQYTGPLTDMFYINICYVRQHKVTIYSKVISAIKYTMRFTCFIPVIVLQIHLMCLVYWRKLFSQLYPSLIQEIKVKTSYRKP